MGFMDSVWRVLTYPCFKWCTCWSTYCTWSGGPLTLMRRVLSIALAGSSLTSSTLYSLDLIHDTSSSLLYHLPNPSAMGICNLLFACLACLLTLAAQAKHILIVLRAGDHRPEIELELAIIEAMKVKDLKQTIEMLKVAKQAAPPLASMEDVLTATKVGPSRVGVGWSAFATLFIFPSLVIQVFTLAYASLNGEDTLLVGLSLGANVLSSALLLFDLWDSHVTEYPPNAKHVNENGSRYMFIILLMSLPLLAFLYTLLFFLVRNAAMRGTSISSDLIIAYLFGLALAVSMIISIAKFGMNDARGNLKEEHYLVIAVVISLYLCIVLCIVVHDLRSCNSFTCFSAETSLIVAGCALAYALFFGTLVPCAIVLIMSTSPTVVLTNESV